MSPSLRSFSARDFDAGRLSARKAGRRVTVVLPARNEAATVAPIVACLRTELRDLVDEVLVIDDGSTDGTGDAAAAAGARVVRGDGRGKGRAMWRGAWEAAGDLVAYCDADVRNFGPQFVVGLLGPLLSTDDVVFVKGYYRRPLDGRAGEGGRVTELMARPVLRVLFPELADLRQPLGGECAAPRDVLERLPFVEGWGVDIGLVLDMADRYGVGALAQVDLGERVHHNRPLDELRPQAEAVLRTALARSGMHPAVAELPPLLRSARYSA